MKTVMFSFTLVITEGISHAMDDDSNKSYSKEICKGSGSLLPLPLVMRWFKNQLTMYACINFRPNSPAPNGRTVR